LSPLWSFIDRWLRSDEKMSSLRIGQGCLYHVYWYTILYFDGTAAGYSESVDEMKRVYARCVSYNKRISLKKITRESDSPECVLVFVNKMEK